MAWIIERDNYLQHYGIKGQKWGVRRYENQDGTLTQEGRERYRRSEARSYAGGEGRAKRDMAMIDSEKNPKKKADAMQSILNDLYADKQDHFNKRMAFIKGDGPDPDLDFSSDKSRYLDEASAWLMNKIIKESGDWYWNEPVSEPNKRISKQIDDLNESIEREYSKTTGQYWSGGYISEKVRKKNPSLDKMAKSMEQLQNDRLGVVLKDIGMDDTPDNRTKIESYVYWD